MILQLDYAFYVWTSYGLFIAIAVWQFIQPRLARRRILAQLREERALETGSYDDTDA